MLNERQTQGMLQRSASRRIEEEKRKEEMRLEEEKLKKRIERFGVVTPDSYNPYSRRPY
jgi:hypothetical protein